MEDIIEQIVYNCSSFIASFQATKNLLKNMDVHIATLI